MKIKFLGGARTVTGSCYLVATGEVKFLVDCGMFQGTKNIKELNYGVFDFDPKEIDFLLLTHAHIDHSGLIPKLVKQGFIGKVYCTSATVELCKIMLPDSGHIQEMEVERKNRKNSRAGKELLEPIYGVEDAKKALSHLSPVEYDQQIIITDAVSVAFRNAGHILGSAMIEVWLKDKGETVKIVFSGDLGDFNQPIIKDPVFISDADIVLIESTYGNKIRYNKEDKKRELLKVIQETMAQGGNLIIPAFAVERTQDLLYYLAQLEQEGYLKGISLFVDSPLAISATEIFCNSESYFDSDTLALANKTNECPFILPGLRFTRLAEESQSLNRIHGGAVIISASGMCDAGRIKHHLKHNLWRKECTILFVGYQAIGTLGQRILSGEKNITIHGEEITVKARITKIEGFSAHADKNTLVNWLKCFFKKPSQVFVTHGEEKNAEELARIIAEELGIKAIVPERLSEFNLREYILPKESLEVQSDFQRIIERVRVIKEELSAVIDVVEDKTQIERIYRQLAQLEQDLIGNKSEQVG
ncbi:MAG: MBL fold metallo-hydrolase [Clostridia bacterium]|jgi:metallo-beta-lactamase family protein|nr:MBL fold metallo-hydrolase [Clostridia bacterium]